jgi:hypothetical protein
VESQKVKAMSPTDAIADLAREIAANYHRDVPALDLARDRAASSIHAARLSPADGTHLAQLVSRETADVAIISGKYPRSAIMR